jgi:NAD(P)-dependent dehydrogenase (short-subunit alcohol dehydrogenase family)
MTDKKRRFNLFSILSLMSLATRLKPAGPTGFGADSTAEEVTEGLSLKGKTVLVTGCSSGLGAESCRVLSLRGAHVLGTARTQAGAERFCAGLPNRATGLACELSDPGSVRNCAAKIREAGIVLDAIICNAGIMATPTLQQASGYELQFFTNHIGHFLLVTGLFDSIASNGRVVVVSSSYHKFAPKGGIQFDNLSGERGYSPWAAYGQSKLANILFAKELQRRFASSKKIAMSVHPGVIPTKLSRNTGSAGQRLLNMLAPVFLKTVQQGAATQLFAAVHPGAAAMGGQYLADCNVARSSRHSEDPALARKLWEVSERIVNAL